MKAADLEALLADYERMGFGYREYHPGRDYGISLSAPQWVKQRVENSTDLELIKVQPRGWGGYQDAVVCIKRAYA